MSFARSLETQPNLADELVRTAKLWLLDLFLKINKPPATLYDYAASLISLLPFWSTPETSSKSQKPANDAAIEESIEALKASLRNQDTASESAALYKLNSSLGPLELEKKQRLSFLIALYEALNKLIPEFNEYSLKDDVSPGNQPCKRIISVVKAYLLDDHTKSLFELGLKPGLLNDKLCTFIAQFSQKPLRSFSTFSIISETSRQQDTPSPPLQQSPSAHKTAAVEMEKASCEFNSTATKASYQQTLDLRGKKKPRPRLQEAARAMSTINGRTTRHPSSRDKKKPSATHASPRVVLDEQSTLIKYRRACLTYQLHLLKQIHYEISKHKKRSPKSTLFRILKLSDEDTPETLANKLTALYSNAEENSTQEGVFMTLANSAKNIAGNLFNLELGNITKNSINEAISNLTHPIYALLDKTDSFKEVWEKYKLVKTLSETTTTARFHQILAIDRNRHKLMTRRDSHLMTFIKMCGLVVATILGSPLLLVGGAYFGYRSLFGTRATEGHKFLNEIDEIKEDARQGKPRLFCRR